MSVNAEQLVEGGSVYYRIIIPRPGAQSETRLKPARVIDVERAAATIQVLDEPRPRTVRFSNLEPDVDYLAGLLRDRDKRAAVQAVDNVVALHAPSANEQTQPLLELKTPQKVNGSLSSSGVTFEPAAQSDLRAWAELGTQLRAQLDEEILSASREQVPQLMARRSELETQLVKTVQSVRTAVQKGAETAPAVEDTDEHMAKKKANGNRYSDAQQRSVLDALAKGMGSKEASAKFGVSYWTVRNWSKIHTAKSRRKGEPTPPTRPAPIVATPSTKRPVERLARPPRRQAAEDIDELVDRAVVERRARTDRNVDDNAIAYARERRERNDGGTAIADARRLNRSLRAMLAALLDRNGVELDAERLVEQNRQLQSVVDLLLGLGHA